jgi:hypothetical protein
MSIGYAKLARMLPFLGAVFATAFLIACSDLVTPSPGVDSIGNPANDADGWCGGNSSGNGDWSSAECDAMANAIQSVLHNSPSGMCQRLAADAWNKLLNGQIYNGGQTVDEIWGGGATRYGLGYMLLGPSALTAGQQHLADVLMHENSHEQDDSRDQVEDGKPYAPQVGQLCAANS